MKARNLAPYELGQQEDWEGNSMAITCPVCSKVYLVSDLIHTERKCPACGKSRGIVSGGRKSGGTATIIWDEAPVFTVGQKYTRKDISTTLGGSEVEYLPTVDKSIVCGCFTLDHNPEAPDVIIPGTGKVIEREAKLFCEQDYPIPIFIKRRPNEWEYVGDYKAARFSTTPTEIAAHHKGSITPISNVTRVVYLAAASRPVGS
jgi:transposase-like protein